MSIWLVIVQRDSVHSVIYRVMSNTTEHGIFYGLYHKIWRYHEGWMEAVMVFLIRRGLP